MKAKPELKLLFLILFTIALYGLSLINFSSKQGPIINKGITEKKLHAAEKEILKFTSTIGSLAIQARSLQSVYDYHKENKKTWEKKGYYFLIYRNDSLFYWTDNRISFANLTPGIIENYTVLKLRNGWYETFNKNFNGTTVLAFLLLKNDFAYQNRFLQNKFNPVLGILSNAEFKSSPSNNSIRINSENGEYLFSVSRPIISQSGILASPKIINDIFLYLVLVLLIYIFYYTGNVILKERNQFLKILYPVILVTFVFIIIILKIPAELFELHLFNPQLYASSVLLSSLGAMLIISFTVFISASYYLRLFKNQIQSSSLFIGIFLVSLFYVCLIVSNNLIYGLIINSSISFDVNNLFSLSIYSLIGFTSITALLFTIYIVGQSALDNLQKYNLKTIFLILIFITSIFIVLTLLFRNLGFFNEVSVGIFLWSFIFLLSVYYLSKGERILFDFSLFLPIIILLSVLSSYLIFKFNKIKEQNNRIVMAQRLERERDYVAEYLFGDISKDVKDDKLLSGLMANPFQNAETIERRINKLYFSGYWNKYETNVFIFDSLAALYYNPTNDSVHIQSFRILIDRKGVATGNADLFFINEESGRPRYVAFLPVNFSSGNFAGTIVVDMEARLIQEQSGFPELLLSSAIVSSTDLSNYSYARYNNSRLILQHGEYAYTLHHVRSGNKVESYRFSDRDKFNHLIYRSGPDSVILLTKIKETWLDYITMFSYMFAIFSILTILYGYFHLIPYKFSFRNLTFKRRIQQSMTWLVVTSLILIGAGTVIYIINRNNIQKKEQITNRLNSALVSIENELLKNGRINELTEELAIKLSQISSLMSADFHIYDATGTIIYSTQPKLFEQGLISNKIETAAYIELSLFNSSRIIQNEKIGNLKFLSAYAPLRNEFSQTLGFLNLPYFARESELRNEISAFLVALVNVYLLLLVLAIIIAVLVANRLTKPLNLIRQKLAQTKLGRQNEYIEWNRKDEIGELVSEYNRMVDQLSESAELLAKSEREHAWREMAKQVAHEIKNPLTPMKLSVQHLERIWKDDTANKEQTIKKLTQTLIQQIDTLSAIATEFSNFAKLPKPQLEEVNIIQLLEGIANLYGQQDNIETNFFSDTDEAIILADKDQLLRIFNNITKNAVQAIPEEEHGLININLSKTETDYLISIHDNGEGIGPDKQSKIFQPNFTTKTGGTGLGLSMVKNIITSMGGEIWFESESGGGTTFFVKLPIGHNQTHS